MSDTTSRSRSSARVGVALAAYKPEPDVFAQQLHSIAVQTHANWICLITLDSSVAELKSAQQLAPYFSDARFIFEENRERLGHKKNFERAIALAVEHDSDAIATCDQDDIWYSDKLAVLVEALRNAGPDSMVHSDMHLLRGETVDTETLWSFSRRVPDNNGCWQTLVANKVTGMSMMFDATLARRFPRIPDSFDYHDHWFALAAASVGRVVTVQRPLGAYRQHATNVVGAREFNWSVSPSIVAEPSSELDAARARWRLLVQRRDDAESEGIPISRSAKRILFRRDGGAALALAGARYFVSDPKLARYCIRLAVGKLAAGRR